MNASAFVITTALFLLLGQLWALAVVRVSRIVKALWSVALAFPSLVIILCFSERGMGRSLAFIIVIYATVMALYGASLSIALSADSEDIPR